MAKLTVRAIGVLLAAMWSVDAQQYVGSRACYSCHSQIYRSFTQTDMGRSMSLADDWKTDVLPAEATLGLPGGSHTYAVSHTDKHWVESETELGVFSVQYPLAYTVGAGTNGLTFLIQRGNYLFQAPISYYSRNHKWEFSPGYEQADLGFGRVVPEECINCHTGRAAPIANRPGSYEDANPFAELAIGCENCHGPGEAHVKSLGKKAGSIVNPAKLAPRLAENICMNCHQGGDTRVLQANKHYLDFRPGQWLFDTAVILKQPARTQEEQEKDLLEHYSAMQASKCFRASNGKLGCLTCHDPHVQPRKEEVTGYYRAKCLTCHTDASCPLPAATRSAQNPPNDCAACHMAKRSVQEISHSALTNHRIPTRPSEPIPAVSQTETDAVIVVNAPPNWSGKLTNVILLRAYAELAVKNPDYLRRYEELLNELSKTEPKDPSVLAALGHRAMDEGRSEEAVTYLKLAIPLENSQVYLELGQALGKLGRGEESIEYLKKGAEMDPYNAVIQKTLILQYINLKSYTEATVRIKQYVETFPEDKFMRDILTRVSR